MTPLTQINLLSFMIAADVSSQDVSIPNTINYSSAFELSSVSDSKFSSLSK